MIVALLGKAGAGKTTIAEALERITPDSFIIDGDDLRAETNNNDIGIDGREKNMHLGYSRAHWLSDLGFTVFVAMQAPIKEIREKYLDENDIQIVINNSGPNPKDDKGYNKNFSADYSDVDMEIEFVDFNAEELYNKIFPKVLVIARFQGIHKGHKIVMEVAKRLSPNITLALRVDEDDEIDLEKNILLASEVFPFADVIKSPDLDDPNEEWENFVSQYDIVVQGNPMVIEKFQKAIDDNKIKLKFVPRVGHVSATKIREAVKNGDEEFARRNIADPKVLELLKEIK